MKNIKVIIWGLGEMGTGIGKMILTKVGIEIVGALEKAPSKLGKDLGEILNHENLGVIVSDDAETLMKEIKADIVIVAIDSFVKSVYPAIKLVVESGKNCITIAEEMAYPYIVEKELSEEMNRLAKKNNVTILGTGVNPGFVLDTLIISLSAACRSVDSIRAERISDLSPFGPVVMSTHGVGLSPEEFEAGIEKGCIVGHIGFAQSIPMIAITLGLDYDEITETHDPIISNTYRETPYVKVEPGMVAGCNHIAVATRKGKPIITLEHLQQIHPECEAVDTGDYIDIKGDTDIHLAIKPETPGGIGTIAMAVNMIPQVISSRSGLKTMMELPIPHNIENSFVEQVNYYK
ncbi:NADP-binding protein [Clostridium bowmanii]|uniref:2,4-diaminopentanoate dehydrogenase n=1 Tax=Clostridium bowmanii TaxID=132925 RepID=UPI001C0E13A6|nr:2,4-diaminopentanoate dehydrogenase [Clostridium bowmanii]MBU3191666.1 NADP-binding protein [Clostridium bowmanii]MCA1076004.1 NADP-binding protein [Clostridium bowmanii]